MFYYWDENMKKWYREIVLHSRISIGKTRRGVVHHRWSWSDIVFSCESTNSTKTILYNNDDDEYREFNWDKKRTHLFFFFFVFQINSNKQIRKIIFYLWSVFLSSRNEDIWFPFLFVFFETTKNELNQLVECLSFLSNSL